jgi:penicillin-binding protein 2
MRKKVILTIIFLLYLLIIIRVADLAVINHKFYTNLANNNIHKKIYLKPIRGIIYDSSHNPIAYNELRFSLLLKPHLKDIELNKTISFINNYIKINKNKIFRNYKKQNSWYNHQFIDVLDYIKYSDIYTYFPILIQNKNIKIESDYLRIYPQKEILSHILGYVGKANQKEISKNPQLKYIKITGKNGIEKEYNKELTGTLGYINVIVNAKNKIIKKLNEVKPTTHNLTLNIDIQLQKFIFNLFKKSNKKGTIIVMDIKGRIISMVNYPSYDNNLFVKGISTKKWQKLIHNNFKPFLNKAIAGLYPPGSVVKPAIGLIAIASGKISPYKKLWCPGYIEIGHRKFRDWRPTGHGWTDIFKAIKRSADTYYYQIGLLLGIDYIAKNLKRMGFGKKTGIDLPNERSGIIPDKSWKLKKYHQNWFIGETLNSSIGQGYVLVTPLQVAVNTALMATGKLPIPQIVKSIDNKIINPKQKDVLTKKEKKLLPFIRKGMWEVCNSIGGTATKHIKIPYFQIAGKTGTAQVHSIPQDVKKRKKEDELAYWKRSHAWLTSYGPYKHPQFIVTAMIEHGGHGGSAAGGMVSEIYKKLVELHYIKVKGK